MRPLKLFQGWTKNTSSLPKIVSFSNLFSPPKFVPPTSLPPLASHLILRSLHHHDSRGVVARAQQACLKLECKQKLMLEAGIGAKAEWIRLMRAHELGSSKLQLSKLQAPKIGPTWDLEREFEGKLPPSCFRLLQRRRHLFFFSTCFILLQQRKQRQEN
jgi:hypothetical protein